MSTPFKPLLIPPGVVATPTKAMRSSNWAEVNLVRWRDSRLSPVGGQLQYNFGRAPIAASGAFTTSSPNIAMPTNPGWVVPGMSVFNVTTGLPVGKVSTYVGGALILTMNALSASSGAADLLEFSSFASRCKLIHGWFGLDGIFRVAYLCETNLYVDVGGIGASTLLDITPSGGMLAPIPLAQGGYGDGLYSDLTYGDPRGPTSPSVMITSVPDAFSLDNFGSILYAMTSADGRLLMWDPAVGGLAVVQPPATGRGPVPLGRCFVVTPQRFIMIFGSNTDGTTGGGGPRRFAWCDQENPGAWDYSSVTSPAGFLDIEPASPIICAISTRVGILFWTGKKAYVSAFLGLPYVYNYTELADATTPWSPQSVVTTSSLTLWMSEQGVFSYDGTSITPVACPVRPWVDADIDEINVREQACAVHVESFNEWWWFYPQLSQPASALNNLRYNSRAIIYNYKEGWWSQAQMARSAGVTAAYNSHTIMANGGLAYEHESASSNQYSTDAALPFAETFNLNLYAGGGSRLITVKQLIPDIDSSDPNNAAGAIANLQYRLLYRNSRSTGTQEQSTPPIQIRPDGYVDFRTTGRDIRMRLEVIPASPVLDFTLGQHEIDAVPRGDR